MAERGGFEPPMPEGIHDFESCAINRTLPPLRRNLTIGHFCSLGKDRIAPDEEHLYHENISLEGIRMNGRMLRFGLASLIALVLLSGTASVFAQVDTPTLPELGPPLRPLIKLIGFINAPPSPMSPNPVLTLRLPGEDRQYTFTLTDMRIMAGPLRTPGDILSEVKPYSTNFYIRAPRDIVTQLSDTSPSQQVTILAEYSRTDRVLFVQSVNKNEEPQLK